MADNRVSFPIESDDVIAVRLTALTGLLTTLNPNLTAGGVFIVEVAESSNIAIFIAGAAAPDTTEPNLLPIPADGIPTGNYEVKTANTKTGTLWDWDAQSEVSNIAIVNTDLKEMLDLYVAIAKIYNALDKEASGYVLDARQGKALSDLITLKVSTTHLASNTNGHGASLIGIEDSEEDFDATTVEAALAELKDDIEAISPDISTFSINVSSDVRNTLILFYMSLVSGGTTIYGFSGYFVIEYFFKNDAGFPSGMTASTEWDTDAIELLGYTVLTIGSTQSMIPVSKPDYDDALYSGGEEDKCTIVYHVRYVNAWTETLWSENKVISSFDPPENIEELLEGLKADDITDFDNEVANNTAVAANTTKTSLISITENKDLDKVANMEVGASTNKHTTITANTVLDWKDAGYIPVSTFGGAVQLTMPPLSTDHVGVEFFISLIQRDAGGANHLTIIADSEDYGFSLIKGSMSDDVGTIEMAFSNCSVIIKSAFPSASNPGYWIIAGGRNVEINVI